MSELVPASAADNPLLTDRIGMQGEFNAANRKLVQERDATKGKLSSVAETVYLKTAELAVDLSASEMLYDFNGTVVRSVAATRNKLRLAAALGTLLIITGIVAWLIVAALAAVDFSILYEVFADKFSDQFGNLSVEAAGLVALAALQGTLAMLTYKVVLAWV